MGDEPEDDEVRQRVRDAILKGGGVPTVAARTGIPPKTLENYLSKRSTPSLDRAAKIAAAAGMTVGELAGEAPKAEASADKSAMPAAVADIMKLVGAEVLRVFEEEGVRIPLYQYSKELAEHTAAVMRRMDDPTDIAELESLMPWLEGRIRKNLREAAAVPGTGKREAS